MIAAIYSRKSKQTETGDSIENQIELCKNYANTYLLKNNEDVSFIIYEDEGFSGSNTNRPKFQQLLKDAKDKKFNCLICYRLDRISRNVADFSSTLELLQNNNIDFVSIKEQFDTSTPMGRAMVYISSVFAQLERETIAERIKDNMYQLAKTGRWLGGQTPLGFNSERVKYFDEEMNEKSMSKLTQVPEELELVKSIYDLYLDEMSLHKVQKHCLANHVKGKNGGQLMQRSIDDILRNPAYVISNDDVFEYFNKQNIITVGTPKGQGLLVYGKRNVKGKQYDKSEWIVAVSNHKGIIPSKKWLRVQELLDRNKNKASKRLGTSNVALLTGLLKCSECGSSMRITYNRPNKEGVRGYHYTCTLKCHSGKTRCANPNANGLKIEKEIIASIKSTTKEDILREFNKKYKNKPKDDVTSNYKAIEKEIKNKTAMMDNLVDQLGNATESASTFIMKKINKLGEEIEVLNKELNKSLIVKDETDKENANLELILQSLEEFKKVFDMLDLSKKKSLLNRMIKDIIYDGYKKKIDINYLI